MRGDLHTTLSPCQCAHKARVPVCAEIEKPSSPYDLIIALRFARLVAHIEVVALAERTSVDVGRLIRFERGRLHLTGPELSRLARALKSILGRQNRHAVPQHRVIGRGAVSWHVPESFQGEAVDEVRSPMGCSSALCMSAAEL